MNNNRRRVPCRFYGTPSGCRMGASCQFDHVQARGGSFRGRGGGRTGGGPRKGQVLRRKWLSVDGDSGDSGEQSFQLLNFNILAEALVDSVKYPGTPVHVLEWSYRGKRLMRYVTDEMASDIVCLQEMDDKHFASFFQPRMSQLGYSGKYKKRTGDKHDGCAIFVRDSVFCMIEHMEVEYKCSDHELMDRDNVALVVVLEHCVTKQKICVCTTHLLYNPGRGDIKLLQLQMLFKILKNTQQAHDECPIILCGDFNSTPNSAVYHYVTEGSLQDGMELDRRKVSGQHRIQHKIHYPNKIDSKGPHGSSGTFRGRFRPPNTLKDDTTDGDLAVNDIVDEFMSAEAVEGVELVEPTAPKRKKFDLKLPKELDCIETGIGSLRSAYALGDYSRSTGEPAFTTFHEGYRGTVDYIFYSPSSLRVVKILSTPNPRDYGKGIPSSSWHSDHIR
mmetsp:Transcript_41030/g.66015  ORF Transcript_41030/g.66015 Transcript_41030/m.66015 type:complete len:446 (-) Transcript_41030:763-2100(-)|eukprot:CAMPEP_0203764496 /NCGR_PEP_ID=MMETSP0098-20131031/17758_1 /ASSEMBLY_ACC=CAM_ASM_000208 /TAXON_ID=96639 /ORGANISM=" , Strain NY0313808BC1" /LENGTH=445 /DNA_ID=CAMNT_0050660423 /DNA_START=136 /DNA_END=1473 /DNA_ORIENTATION=+